MSGIVKRKTCCCNSEPGLSTCNTGTNPDRYRLTFSGVTLETEAVDADLRTISRNLYGNTGDSGNPSTSNALWMQSAGDRDKYTVHGGVPGTLEITYTPGGGSFQTGTNGIDHIVHWRNYAYVSEPTLASTGPHSLPFTFTEWLPSYKGTTYCHGTYNMPYAQPKGGGTILPMRVVITHSVNIQSLPIDPAFPSVNNIPHLVCTSSAQCYYDRPSVYTAATGIKIDVDGAACWFNKTAIWFRAPLGTLPGVGSTSTITSNLTTSMTNSVGSGGTCTIERVTDRNYLGDASSSYRLQMDIKGPTTISNTPRMVSGTESLDIEMVRYCEEHDARPIDKRPGTGNDFHQARWWGQDETWRAAIHYLAGQCVLLVERRTPWTATDGGTFSPRVLRFEAQQLYPLQLSPPEATASRSRWRLLKSETMTPCHPTNLNTYTGPVPTSIYSEQINYTHPVITATGTTFVCPQLPASDCGGANSQYLIAWMPNGSAFYILPAGGDVPEGGRSAVVTRLPSCRNADGSISRVLRWQSADGSVTLQLVNHHSSPTLEATPPLWELRVLQTCPNYLFKTETEQTYGSNCPPIGLMSSPRVCSLYSGECQDCSDCSESPTSLTVTIQDIGTGDLLTMSATRSAGSDCVWSLTQSTNTFSCIATPLSGTFQIRNKSGGGREFHLSATNGAGATVEATRDCTTSTPLSNGVSIGSSITISGFCGLTSGGTDIYVD